MLGPGCAVMCNLIKKYCTNKMKNIYPFMVCWFLLLSHLCCPLSTKLRNDVLSTKVRCVLNYLLLTSKLFTQTTTFHWQSLVVQREVKPVGTGHMGKGDRAALWDWFVRLFLWLFTYIITSVQTNFPLLTSQRIHLECPWDTAHSLEERISLLISRSWELLRF